MEEEEKGMEDRIKEMAGEIKQEILSYLSTKEALSTGLLSSNWRYTWVTLPSFDFGYGFFSDFSNDFDNLPKSHPQRHLLYHTFHDTDSDSDSDYYTDEDDDDKYNNLYIPHVGYMELLDRIFQVYTKNRKPYDVIKKLSLYVPIIYPPKMRAFASIVALQWLSVAQHTLQDLTLCVAGSIGKAGSYHVFQNCYRILQSKTLTKLELEGCYLSTEDEIKIEFHLPCLKHLSLISFKVGQKMLDILLANCVALEKLKLLYCQGFTVLRVPELSMLEEVQVTGIHDLHRVEIDSTAVALQCLTLVELKINRCKLKVASNVCTNLFKLFVNGCGITDDVFNNVADFPNLKTLSLLDCPMLKHIKIKSPSLTTFDVEVCPNLGVIELDAPNVSDFTYSSTGNNNIITLLSKTPITRAALHLKRPRSASRQLNLWHSKLLTLLENFSQSTYVDLTTNSKKNVIIPQELRASFCPPLCNVQDLSLTVTTSLTSRNVPQYLENLLWLSPYPRTISLSSTDLKSYLSLQLHYEDKIKEGEIFGDHLAKPINCLRRVLKNFRIVDRRGLRVLGDFESIRKVLEHALNQNKATACGELIVP